MVNDDVNNTFSQRINELLDTRGFVGAGNGRQVELAKKYGLVQQSVGKWLKGEGMPKTTQMIRIALDFNCNFEWLALGRGPRDPELGTKLMYAELLQRIESADAETKKLVELALLPDADLGKSELSPSLKGLVGFLKQQIREEIRDPDAGKPPQKQ